MQAWQSWGVLWQTTSCTFSLIVSYTLLYFNSNGYQPECLTIKQQPRLTNQIKLALATPHLQACYLELKIMYEYFPLDENRIFFIHAKIFNNKQWQNGLTSLDLPTNWMDITQIFVSMVVLNVKLHTWQIFRDCCYVFFPRIRPKDLPWTGFKMSVRIQIKLPFLTCTVGDSHSCFDTQ